MAFMGITLYIFQLVLTIGLGGFIFGYETGVMASALLSIRHEFPGVDTNKMLQEWIVSIAPLAAFFGALLGIFLNNFLGRRRSLISSITLYFFGVMITMIGQPHGYLLFGRFVVGIALGIISTSCPIYTAEVCPNVNLALPIITYLVMILFGQFVTFVTTTTLNKVTGTWRLMLGCGLIPSGIQIVLVLKFLVESPYWQYFNNDYIGGRATMERVLVGVVPEDQIITEITRMEATFHADHARHANQSFFAKILDACADRGFWRAIAITIGTQAAQQFFGINTVLYYSNKFAQGAKYNNNGALSAFSLVFLFAKFFGTVFGLFAILRLGKKRLFLFSYVSILIAMLLYGVLFVPKTLNPQIDPKSTLLPTNLLCAQYLSASNPSSWSCSNCIDKACGFCPSKIHDYRTPGLCMANSKNASLFCEGGGRVYYDTGCPNKYGFLNVILVAVYMVLYSPGLGTVPWILSIEYYTTRYRAVGGGVAACINWGSAFFVRTISKIVGDKAVFFGAIIISTVLMIFSYKYIPESNEFRLEEVSQLTSPPVPEIQLVGTTAEEELPLTTGNGDSDDDDDDDDRVGRDGHGEEEIATTHDENQRSRERVRYLRDSLRSYLSQLRSSQSQDEGPSHQAEYDEGQAQDGGQPHQTQDKAQAHGEERS